MSEIPSFDWDFRNLEDIDSIEEGFRGLDAQDQIAPVELQKWAWNFPLESRIHNMIIEQTALKNEDSLEPARAIVSAMAELKLGLLYDYDIYVRALMDQEDDPDEAISRARESLRDEMAVDLQAEGEELIPIVEAYLDEISEAYSELPAMGGST
jgi:hypothetical protein